MDIGEFIEESANSGRYNNGNNNFQQSVWTEHPGHCGVALHST